MTSRLAENEQVELRGNMDENVKSVIRTKGADLFIVERPGGGWAIQQAGRHILVTRDEARQLAGALSDLMDRDYEPTTPAKWVQK